MAFSRLPTSCWGLYIFPRSHFMRSYFAISVVSSVIHYHSLVLVSTKYGYPLDRFLSWNYIHKKRASKSNMINSGISQYILLSYTDSKHWMIVSFYSIMPDTILSQSQTMIDAKIAHIINDDSYMLCTVGNAAVEL